MSEQADSKRIVVTGMGAITPVGRDLTESWHNIIDGQHGIRPIGETALAKYDDYDSLGAKVLAEVVDFDLLYEPVLAEHKADLDNQNWHRSVEFAFVAMYQALSAAGLLKHNDVKLTEDIDPFRVGSAIGSTFSGGDHTTPVGKRPRPSDLFKSLIARPATATAMQLNLKGPGGFVGDECASGSKAIYDGVKILREVTPLMDTDADVMVVGGTDAGLSPANIRYFDALKRAVDPSDDPATASAPFDKSANGLVMGEGAGALVLETREHALSRGIETYAMDAEIVGYAHLTDAENKTKAGMEGTVRAIKRAMQMAKIALGETVYFNAHATSTSDGDPIEATAIMTAIKELELDPRDFYVTSTKGATGHTLGAAGAIEAAFAIKALQQGIVPPALKLHNPIEEVKGFNLSPLQATRLNNIDAVMSTSLGFGGPVTALAFRKADR